MQLILFTLFSFQSFHRRLSFLNNDNSAFQNILHVLHVYAFMPMLNVHVLIHTLNVHIFMHTLNVHISDVFFYSYIEGVYVYIYILLHVSNVHIFVHILDVDARVFMHMISVY